MQDLVLIGAPARLGGANLGTVAVIAPTRIQYQEMIQAVRYIARLSERILEIPPDQKIQLSGGRPLRYRNPRGRAGRQPRRIYH